mmetsp:Transcript_22019/g.34979  ORF Transcript_22019/g.34979 Transcript_22019/m.34979 type:complete len:158 (+) Transcript_22019:993-1466(+)
MRSSRSKGMGRGLCGPQTVAKRGGPATVKEGRLRLGTRGGSAQVNARTLVPQPVCLGRVTAWTTPSLPPFPGWMSIALRQSGPSLGDKEPVNTALGLWQCVQAGLSGIEKKKTAGLRVGQMQTAVGEPNPALDRQTDVLVLLGVACGVSGMKGFDCT